MTHEELIDKRSWLNVLMLFNTIPSFGDNDNDTGTETPETEIRHINDIAF